MPSPHDYRWDPFTNVSTAINIKERRIIPSKSPYIIRLTEVPVKAEPSTMSVRAITTIAASPSYGATFTEVAASPSANQFRPDYSTGANQDESWNSGLVEFSSSNAGAVVEITYQGSGTLAGVSSNRYPSWWNARGDGSKGDVVATNGSTLASGMYKSLHIPAGVTVNLNSGCTIIMCTELFSLYGTINGVGKGASGGAYISLEGATSVSNPGGKGMNAASGSNGTGSGASAESYGRIYYGSLPSDLESIIHYSPSIPIIYGGGGSSGYDGNKPGYAGGTGGGGIVIIAKDIVQAGNINTSGTSGNHSENAGGDGGGGGALLIGETVINTGSYTHTGGYAGWHKVIEMGVQ